MAAAASCHSVEMLLRASVGGATMRALSRLSHFLSGSPRNPVHALHLVVAEVAPSGLGAPGAACDAVLEAMTAVEASDLGVGSDAAAAAAAATGRRSEVWHVPIAETAAYSICIFILGPNASIPLHDHPGMTVLSKVLRGSVTATSFDVVEALAGGRVRAAPSATTAAAPATLALFPDAKNVHEFVAGPEGVAILEVLSPPYDAGDGRDCHYFRVVTEDAKGDDVLLEAYPCPDDFCCLGAPYTGSAP